MKTTVIDLTGKRFGYWTVLKRVENDPNNHAKFLCKCDCGTEKILRGMFLRRGASISCGCYRKNARTTHGMTPKGARPQVYNAWAAALQRCYNPSVRNFGRYGGRGITVCERWHKFDNFLADMGEPPSPKHSLDRINNNGHYEPSNCRWATIETQANNTRTNVFLTFNNETHTIIEWSKKLNINHVALSWRINNHWPVEKALTTPIKHH